MTGWTLCQSQPSGQISNAASLAKLWGATGHVSSMLRLKEPQHSLNSCQMPVNVEVFSKQVLTNHVTPQHQCEYLSSSSSKACSHFLCLVHLPPKFQGCSQVGISLFGLYWASSVSSKASLMSSLLYGILNVCFFCLFLVKAKYSSTMTAKRAAAQTLQLEQAEQLIKSVQKKPLILLLRQFFFPPLLFYSPNNKLTLNFPQAAVSGDISPCPQMFLLIKSDILCGAINHYLLLFCAWFWGCLSAEKSNQMLFPEPKFLTKSTSAVFLSEKKTRVIINNIKTA